MPIILTQLRALCADWKPHGVLLEDKSTGEAIIQPLRDDKQTFPWPVIPIMPPSGMDKVVRFAASTPAMRDGQVWLPRRGHPGCPWLPRFEAELFHYPNTAEKDQGDMVSQFLNWRREHPLPQTDAPLSALFRGVANLAPALDGDEWSSTI